MPLHQSVYFCRSTNFTACWQVNFINLRTAFTPAAQPQTFRSRCELWLRLIRTWRDGSCELASAPRSLHILTGTYFKCISVETLRGRILSNFTRRHAHKAIYTNTTVRLRSHSRKTKAINSSCMRSEPSRALLEEVSRLRAAVSE